MTVLIKFSGWFQCRLATAPDPTDEPRGVSGYAHALPNEPDFDRIIRLQPKDTIQRSHCQSIGVKVTNIWIDGSRADNHPLLGALVDFLDYPKFEGRNDILTREGEEAVVPINIQIKKDCFLIQRKFDDTMNFPPSTINDFEKFNNLKATGVHLHSATIQESTGIFDLYVVWQDRKSRLEADLQAATNEIEKSTLKARIKLLSNSDRARDLARRFFARMLYSVSLSGSLTFNDPNGFLTGKPALNSDTNKPMDWSLEFWCGGWDADALSGYIEGYLGFPIESDDENNLSLSEDINQMIKEPLKRRL
jgi:hypothetical protein